MNNRPNTEGGIPFKSIGKVGAKIQLIDYQYFRQLFILNLFDFDTLVVSI